MSPMFGDGIIQQLMLAMNLINCLKCLKLEENGVFRVSDGPNLKDEKYVMIDCDHREIEKIDPSLYNLKSVESLHISHCPNLDQLSSWIQTLENLRSIWVSFSPDLKAIPEWFGNLANLEKVVFQNCGITSLPASMRNLVNLITLDLRRNHLTEIPDWILGLKHLKNLYLENNRIAEVPGWVNKLLNRSVSIELGGNRLNPTTIDWINKSRKPAPSPFKRHLPLLLRIGGRTRSSASTRKPVRNSGHSMEESSMLGEGGNKIAQVSYHKKESNSYIDDLAASLAKATLEKQHMPCSPESIAALSNSALENVKNSDAKTAEEETHIDFFNTLRDTQLSTTPTVNAAISSGEARL